MVYDCITEKLVELKCAKSTTHKNNSSEINEIRLKIKTIEKSEEQLMDTMLTNGFDEALLALANQKATQFKRDKAALYERLEELKSTDEQSEVVINLAKSWKQADYRRKKAVAKILIHQININEDGSIQIIWNI